MSNRIGCFYSILEIMVLLVGVCFSSISFAKKIEAVSIYYVKQTIADKMFVYREDIVNGIVKKNWTIDDEAVNKSVYLDALLDAEMQERRAELMAHEAQREASLQEKFGIMIAANKKLLQTAVAEVTDWLRKLSDNRLSSYYIFNEQTYRDKDQFYAVQNELLPAAQTLLQQDSDVDLNTLSAMVTRLENEPKRLQDLFYATTNNAIKLCKDTRVLKELLGLVAHT